MHLFELSLATRVGHIAKNVYSRLKLWAKTCMCEPLFLHVWEHVNKHHDGMRSVSDMLGPATSRALDCRYMPGTMH